MAKSEMSVQLQRLVQCASNMGGNVMRFALRMVIVAACLLVLPEASYRVYKLAVYGMVDYPDQVSLGAFHRDEQYGSLPTPNFSFDMIPNKVRFNPGVGGFEADVSFNRWGYRGREFSKAKPPRTFRIIAFGGSTTMSLESDDDKTWPSVLERLLNNDAQNQQIEMINAGISGSRTREGLIRLKSEAQYFQPDLLLVAYGWNDVTRGVEGEDPSLPASTSTPWWYHSAVLQNVRIRTMARMNHDPRRHARLLANLKRDSAWSQAYVMNLLEMNRIASAIGARTMLVNLPGLPRNPTSRGKDEYDLIIKNTRVTPENFDYWVAVKDYETALLADVGHEHGIPVIDVSRAFDQFSGAQRLSLFVDEMHLNDAGAREVAVAIHGHIGDQ